MPADTRTAGFSHMLHTMHKKRALRRHESGASAPKPSSGDRIPGIPAAAHALLPLEPCIADKDVQPHEPAAESIGGSLGPACTCPHQCCLQIQHLPGCG